jgi:hypothetical protein
MDDGMLLDAFFVTIAVLCLPIGFGRGVIRETFVSAGFLFGALLASSWARPWGIDIADSLDITVGTGQFVVSTGFVVGAALLFGYGGAAAAHIPQPRRWTRLTGAVLAVCNGALIIGLILRDIERYLADGDAIQRIEESEIADVLLREFGWVLLGAAGTVFVLMLGGLLVRERAPTVAPLAASSPQVWTAPTEERQKRRPRLRWGRDDGKVEPVERGFDPATGRYQSDAPTFGDTMSVAAVAATTWSLDRAHGLPRGYDEWLNVSRPPEERRVTPDPPVARENDARCESCGERLAPHEAFCPRCGRARNAPV